MEDFRSRQFLEEKAFSVFLRKPCCLKLTGLRVLLGPSGSTSLRAATWLQTHPAELSQESCMTESLEPRGEARQQMDILDHCLVQLAGEADKSFNDVFVTPSSRYFDLPF